MLLGENNREKEKHYQDKFDTNYMEEVEFCGQLISRSMFEEAWTMMETLKQESIPLLLNKALCLYEMERNSEALKITDRILVLLTTMKNRLPIQPSREIQELHEVQKNQVTYLNPVTFRYVDLFPETLKISVLRFAVDLYSELGNTAKVLEIATPLQSKGYRNITEALSKITNK